MSFKLSFVKNLLQKFENLLERDFLMNIEFQKVNRKYYIGNRNTHKNI